MDEYCKLIRPGSEILYFQCNPNAAKNYQNVPASAAFA